MAAELLGTPLPPLVEPDAAAVRLLDGPYVVLGGRRLVPPSGSKRLLAFVALHGDGVERRVAAGTLWPIGDDDRATGNLRSALWRLRSAGIDVVESDKWALRLRAGTVVDLRVTLGWAARVVEDRMRSEDLTTTLWRSPAALLPGWGEDWVLFERERLRQRLLHGLEALSRHYVRGRRYDEAVDVAGAAVAMEPLRESARRVLIEAHLAAGDAPRALRAYAEFGELAFRELRVRPSPGLTALTARSSRETPGDLSNP